MIRAAEVRTKADWLALLLQNASRVTPGSSSARQLRDALNDPEVLDILDRAVSLLREREQ